MNCSLEGGDAPPVSLSGAEEGCVSTVGDHLRACSGARGNGKKPKHSRGEYYGSVGVTGR